MTVFRTSVLAALGVFTAVSLSSCDEPYEGPRDTEFSSDLAIEIFFDTNTGTDTEQGVDSPVYDIPSDKPEGYASIKFKVDDTANKTYSNGQMKWTGSFAWDDASNTIEYASAWLPSDGPFVPLWDDGPRSEGGHEPTGAVAGDNVFEAEVFVLADEAAITFEYGVLNELDRWIWVGPNGLVTIPAGSTDVFVVEHLVFEAFGNADIKVELNLAAINPDFSANTPDIYDFYFKSSANSWTPVQLLENGGVFTYIQSERLGSHDGLLSANQHDQFVFAFAIMGQDPDSAQEYKVSGVALQEGVSAYLRNGSDGDWTRVDIDYEKAARGREFNTTVIVGGGLPWCTIDDDCYGDGTCGENGCETGEVRPSEPTITGVEPGKGPVSGGTSVTLTGTDFKTGASVTFGGTGAVSVTVVSGTEVTAVTPAHAEGTVDVVLTNTDTGTATKAGAFEYEDLEISSPNLFMAIPDHGVPTGGTQVILSGSDFMNGATVTFGEVLAVSVVFDSASQVTVVTPAHAVGKVDITITNPDSGTDTIPQGFTYAEDAGPDYIDWGIISSPQEVSTYPGVATPTLQAQVWEDGVTGGGDPAGFILGQCGYGPQGSDPATDDSGWTWDLANFAGAGGDTGNNAIYTASWTPETVGTYAFTFRFSMDNGDSWKFVDSDGVGGEASLPYSAEKLGLIRVLDLPVGPYIHALTPTSGPMGGGSGVSLTGLNFVVGSKVLIDGTEVSTTFLDAQTLVFKTVAHAIGPASITVLNPDTSSGEKQDAFTFTAFVSTGPTMDGSVGSDWPDDACVWINSTDTNWGAQNYLQKVCIAYDGWNLYVGIVGGTEIASPIANSNAILLYLDQDLGAGTGTSDMANLTDGDGAVDNALSSGVKVSQAGFGAEVGFAVIGMADSTGDNALLTGWRVFDPINNFYWINEAQVVSGTNSIETSVPLGSAVGQTGNDGTDLGIVIRLGNHDGTSTSNQAIPDSLEAWDAWTSTSVIRFPIR